MKTLYLLRHAKASWKDSGQGDIKRPLKKKGHLQADALSDHLSSLLPPPEQILCSPSVRTRQTLDYFLEVWPLKTSAQSFADRLYLGSVETLLTAVRALPDTSEVALMVGHNPGLTDLLHLLVGGMDDGTSSLRTCEFVQIDFQTANWADLGPDTGAVKFILRAKDLTE